MSSLKRSLSHSDLNAASNVSRRSYLATGGALALAAGLPWMAGCSGQEAAPNVAYKTLEGQAAQLSGLRGKVVLVNFWATSCATCIQEMPDLVAAHQQYQAQGYETLAVAMNYDNPAYVANFVKSRKLPFQVTHDADGNIARSFGEVRLTPTSYLLDKQGKIVKKYVGEPDMPAFRALVADLLKQA